MIDGKVAKGGNCAPVAAGIVLYYCIVWQRAPTFGNMQKATCSTFVQYIRAVLRVWGLKELTHSSGACLLARNWPLRHFERHAHQLLHALRRRPGSSIWPWPAAAIDAGRGRPVVPASKRRPACVLLLPPNLWLWLVGQPLHGRCRSQHPPCVIRLCLDNPGSGLAPQLPLCW